MDNGVCIQPQKIDDRVTKVRNQTAYTTYIVRVERNISSHFNVNRDPLDIKQLDLYAAILEKGHRSSQRQAVTTQVLNGIAAQVMVKLGRANAWVEVRCIQIYVQTELEGKLALLIGV